MELSKLDVSTSCYRAFLLLLVSSACLGQKGIVKQWSNEGTVNFEYQAIDYPTTQRDESPTIFRLNSEEGDTPKMPVENQCLEGFNGPNGLALLKVHVKTSSAPAYTLEALDFKGQCNIGVLSQKLYVKSASKGEELKNEPVKEIYELRLRIKEDERCYKRTYTVTQTDLEVVVAREEPEHIEDCGDLQNPKDVDGPVSTFEAMSPSGTYHQTVFDDSETEVIAELSKETLLKCRKTLVSRLRLIFVANVSHQGLVIDRFEVKSCWKDWLKASFQVDNKDASKVKITFKSDDVCYERSYEIIKSERQKSSDGTEEQLKSKVFPVYTVTKSEAKTSTCPPMKRLSKMPEEKDAEFTRYPEEEL